MAAKPNDLVYKKREEEEKEEEEEEEEEVNPGSFSASSD